jgi:hypothetical protein
MIESRPGESPVGLDWELDLRVRAHERAATNEQSTGAVKRPDSDTANTAMKGPPQWHFYISTPAHHHMKEISSFSDFVFSYFV